MEPLGLLIESGRRSLGAAPRELIVPREAWTALPDLAERHGMTAWVHAAAGGTAPSDVRAAIEARARAQRLRALHAVSQLTLLVRDLRNASVETVALKGPLFAAWLHGDLGMRRFADLDLLVAFDQRERALDVLAASGYSLRDDMSLATARVVYAGTCAWPLSHPAGIAIDLHWRAQALGFPAPLSPREVLQAAATTPGTGGNIRIPSPTHAAVLGVLHAAKHLWTSLELVLSIAHLTRRTDVDWSEVDRLAARAGAANACAAGLLLARDLFDVLIPPAIEPRVQSAAVRALVQSARGFLAMPDVAGAPLAAEIRAHCGGLDTLRGRVRYAAWRLLAPTPLEAAWWPLPDRFAPLYAPVRWLRLAVRRGKERVPQ